MNKRVQEERSKMKTGKEIIGGPLIINGRQLTLSKAVRAGDFIFLTGQVPMKDGAPMTDGTIEEQTSLYRIDSRDAQRCRMHFKRCC